MRGIETRFDRKELLIPPGMPWTRKRKVHPLDKPGNGQEITLDADHCRDVAFQNKGAGFIGQMIGRDHDFGQIPPVSGVKCTEGKCQAEIAQRRLQNCT